MGKIESIKMSMNLVPLESIIRDRYFKIPDYQRGFSWDERQLKDLTSDIEKLFTKNHKHFTGTIVATPTSGTKDEFDIVDGQQRITSLILLINEIINYNPDRYGYLKEIYIVRGALGNEKQVLEANSETNFFFREILIDNKIGNPEVKSHERIKSAKLFFKTWLFHNKKEVDRITEIIKNQLGFLFFIPENTKEIGIMFEVINNRGKSLSELEKIKNYFIYYATIFDKKTLRDNVDNKWGKILFNLSKAGIISNEDEDGFIRNCYIVYFDYNKSRSHHVYDELKERFKVDLISDKFLEDNIRDIHCFIDFLVESSLNYAYLKSFKYFQIQYQGEEKVELAKVISKLRCQPDQASILPLYLTIMSFLKEPQKVVQLLNILEILNFRVYILPKITHRADSKQANLFYLANDAYNDSSWSSNDKSEEVTLFGNKKITGDIYNWLELNLIEFTKHFCSELKFVQSLTIDEDEPEDYYHWNGLRFFLANYEHYLEKKDKHSWDIENILKSKLDVAEDTNDFLSLEHIWAKKNRKYHFGENHLQKRRLGNFVLMGLSKNIKLQDEDIFEKIKIMTAINKKRNFGPLKLSQVAALEDFCNQSKEYVEISDKHKRKTENYYMKLAARINDLRETDMIIFALDRWCLPGERLDRFDRVDSFEAWGLKKKENFFMK